MLECNEGPSFDKLRAELKRKSTKNNTKGGEVEENEVNVSDEEFDTERHEREQGYNALDLKSTNRMSQRDNLSYRTLDLESTNRNEVTGRNLLE